MKDPIAISALQHWCYCPRQCGLIHLEQVFAENVFTLRGQAVHSRVDKQGQVDTREGLRVARALPIWSEQLNLIGKADVVEYLPDGTPYPVEYKLGSRNKAKEIAKCDELQLAAQAMCLEEMTGLPVNEGAIFYSKTKRRKVVEISNELRDSVRETTNAIQTMLERGKLPAPTPFAERCEACSLSDICQPQIIRQMDADRSTYRNLFDPNE
ncbi:MAG: CRISPR-associated protein Cas4 [Burkholderiales bacterium]|uniref:CRISPR-associated protein Cas4 n=1 Tax=Limnobacter sp. TaxID=2003368 RepID=UPI0039629726|nr:CRISPR-associated protein Cas4 [Burkholderiales bacterium]